MPAIEFYPYKEDPLLRSIRIKTWFIAVTNASGLSKRELEEMFREDNGRKVKRSCIWHKYSRGEVAPRAGYRKDGRPNLLEQVEARYPGTSKWLLSPMWRLSDPAPMEMSELRQVYAGLPEIFRLLFIVPGKTTHGRFWRAAVSHIEAYEVLSRKADIDAITAALALVKEAETKQCLQSYKTTALTATRFLKMLENEEPNQIFPLMRSQFFDYLHNLWRISYDDQISIHHSQVKPHVQIF